MLRIFHRKTALATALSALLLAPACASEDEGPGQASANVTEQEPEGEAQQQAICPADPNGEALNTVGDALDGEPGVKIDEEYLMDWNVTTSVSADDPADVMWATFVDRSVAIGGIAHFRTSANNDDTFCAYAKWLECEEGAADKLNREQIAEVPALDGIGDDVEELYACCTVPSGDRTYRHMTIDLDRPFEDDDAAIWLVTEYTGDADSTECQETKVNFYNSGE